MGNNEEGGIMKLICTSEIRINAVGVLDQVAFIKDKIYDFTPDEEMKGYYHVINELGTIHFFNRKDLLDHFRTQDDDDNAELAQQIADAPDKLKEYIRNLLFECNSYKQMYKVLKDKIERT